LRHTRPRSILDIGGVFLFLLVVFMDVIEAQRNLKRYRSNVTALQQVHPQDLSVDEINTIASVIRKHNRLINNIEEQLHQGERRERR
jgi:hypothetical protein